jgi:hypothetical protein
VYGALDDGSGRVLRYLAPQKGGTSIAGFLDQFAQTWPADHLILVMDNVSDRRSQIKHE